MTTDTVTIDAPAWEPSKIKVADTVLQEHASLINGVTGNTIQQNNIETAARLIIGMMMSGETENDYNTLMESFQSEYNTEKTNIEEHDRILKEKTAYTRAWLNLINKANRYFGKFVRSKGNEIRIMVTRKTVFDDLGDQMTFSLPGGVNPFELARHIAKILTGKRTQDVRILVVGATGSGKSELAMALAECIAIELSKILDGDESHGIKYFDHEKDVGIITPERLLTVMCRETEPHHIKILDDIGMSEGFDARQWQSDANDATTSLFGVNRTQRGVLIVTVQSHHFIDKKLRALFNWFIEVSGPMYVDQCVNIAKVYQITLHPRDKQQPIHFPFVREIDQLDGHMIIYKYLATGFASLAARNWYKPIRQNIVNEINNGKLKLVINPETESNNITKPKNPGKPVCPNCFTQNVRYRKKTNDYVCISCGKDFKSDIAGNPVEKNVCV